MSKQEPMFVYVFIEISPWGIPTFKHKIGITNDVAQRHADQQTGNADTIGIVGVVEVGNDRRLAKAIEKKVHTWLEPLHIRGEHFFFPPYLDVIFVWLVHLAKWTTYK